MVSSIRLNNGLWPLGQVHAWQCKREEAIRWSLLSGKFQRPTREGTAGDEVGLREGRLVSLHLQKNESQKLNHVVNPSELVL